MSVKDFLILYSKSDEEFEKENEFITDFIIIIILWWVHKLEIKRMGKCGV